VVSGYGFKTAPEVHPQISQIYADEKEIGEIGGQSFGSSYGII
jgi:hypothetical protein